MTELEKQIEMRRLNKLSEVSPDYPCTKCEYGLQCIKWQKQDSYYAGCHKWWNWFKNEWRKLRKELKSVK